MEHEVQFMSCGCEPLAVSLAKAELWPATPTNPRYAFSFTLLDWAEALLLEAQVSLKDFCKTLKFRCRLNLLKVTFMALPLSSLLLFACTIIEEKRLLCTYQLFRRI